ncbi:zinc-binding alcohol dehydrogenase family protein [Phaeobacter gallaeciensis]|uniref:zinc-binding alcohol dehydrogenase family protein n=1 Tax=Phaeobacter gallaeciensis TaxID=60890 RepID=UPI000BBB7D1E|nr:zinc-binding alcohol dehydrogenase family protein [Phaeobacter gallaeciensis]ATF20644.1 zinc-binding protein alcohol dehydrogenase family protein [Phaeobacter gallaeciensis]ATF24753.1 zinc-binding protein alcohol dehydrogenase family protein [Phaeobacter gallaeciensis]
MKAVGFTRSHPIDHPDSLKEYQVPKPEPLEHDLIVRIDAVSVNPADAKIRIRSAQDQDRETPRILGYDAVGTIAAIGSSVTGFALGDRVFYAGDVTRDGSYAEYQAVDARIAAKAPQALTNAEAAALPLVSLTAYEALFDRMKLSKGQSGTLLIIGGAGGVGSTMIQLAKALTNMTVIATASRRETRDWVQHLGADHVADHRDLVSSVRDLGFENVDSIFNAADTKGHWEAMADLIAPQGTIGAIVEFDGGVDLSKLQGKSVTFVWELMFTRSLFGTSDLPRQGEILSQITDLAETGQLRPTVTQEFAGLSAASFKAAHQSIETGATIGKISVTY